MIYGKKILQGIDVMVMTAWQLTIGGAAIFLVGLGIGGQLHSLKLESTMLLLYLALISSATFAIWSALLKYNPVGTVTIFNFLVPVFGSLLSAVFLGEDIYSWKTSFALLLVCAGIYLVTTVVQQRVVAKQA